jgi:hypothetical protein
MVHIQGNPHATIVRHRAEVSGVASENLYLLRRIHFNLKEMIGPYCRPRTMRSHISKCSSVRTVTEVFIKLGYYDKGGQQVMRNNGERQRGDAPYNDSHDCHDYYHCPATLVL